MAAPAYATDLNDIFLDGGASSWSVITSGGPAGAQTDPDTDDFIQGSSCWSRAPFSSAIKGGLYPSTETIATDDAVFFWLKADAVAALDTHAAGGMQALIGDASTAFDCFYVRGSDDYQYGGWICAVSYTHLTLPTILLV